MSEQSCRREVSNPPRPAGPAPRLVLGPALRHVGSDCAVVWVQASHACEIELRLRRDGRAERRYTASTFGVHGRHYALVAARGLFPGWWYEYEVWAQRRGGAPTQVWPDRRTGTRLPPSSFRTLPAGAGGEVRLAVVSCRAPESHDAAGDTEVGVDALKLFARALKRDYPMRRLVWPQALLEIGDQVYADSVSRAMEAALKTRHEKLGVPVDEVVDFPEFAALYEEAWGDDEIRWMRSCIPTIDIFDDHEVVDDWNINSGWLEEQRAQPWRIARIRAGLLAYWIYQGAGNLAPEAWAADERMQALIGTGTLIAAGGQRDVTRSAESLFGRYAAGTRRARWGYERRIGPLRVIVGDCRARRDLEANRMMDDDEWAWFRDAVLDAREPHLLLVLTLPVILPDGIRELEASSAASREFPWTLDPLAAIIDSAFEAGEGKPLRRYVQERVDLEHWPAFPESFDAFVDLLEERMTAPGRTTRSLVLLSGDVHFSYGMSARLAKAPGRLVHQLVVSPVRNRLSPGNQSLFRVMAGPHGRALVDLGRALLAAHGGAGVLPVNPKADATNARLTTSLLSLGAGNLLFDNVVATLRTGPAGSELRFDAAAGAAGQDVPGYGNRALRPAGRLRLAIA